MQRATSETLNPKKSTILIYSVGLTTSYNGG